MNTKSFIKPLSLLIIVAFVVGCNNSQKQSGKQSNSIRLSTENSLEEQLEFFRFPSPDEILGFVEETNLEFKYNIVNSPENVNAYNTHTWQTLNLGVYATDLAYLAVYKKHDAMVRHLSAVSQLSQTLRIEAAFPEGFIEKASENINSVDSLARMSEQAFQYLSTYLEGSGNEQTLALLTLGTYVESLYLIANSIDDYDSHPDVIQIVSDQKFAFENLNDFIKQHIDAEFYKEHFEIIGKVNQVYSRMNKTKVPATTEKPDGDMLVIGSDYTYLLSEKDFNELKSLITEKRNAIVNDSKNKDHE